MTSLAQLLTTPKLFSQHVLHLPLYRYQTESIQAVLNAVLSNSGLEFLVIMPRQSGKNEAIAHLLVQLLNLFQRRGGQIVYGAIGDGIGRGIGRLEARLENSLNAGRWKKIGKPTRRQLGKAAVVFLSSHPAAYSRGETADILLVIDELQDQTASHLEAVFEPMRAAKNASAVFLGTVKFTHDALWQKKQELERKTAQDGLQRVFLITPDQVTAENPYYGCFLAAKIDQFGRHHPIIASEYFLEPVDAAGGLFDGRRAALMRGNHARYYAPKDGKLYVAVIDVGGQDEATTNAVALLDNPRRDYTICTIFEINIPTTIPTIPAYSAVDVLVAHGDRHFQTIPGRPSLAERLNAYLNHWHVLHTVCDASGVGEGLTDWLKASRGETAVTGYQFSTLSKAALGSAFLTIIETGRFHYWTDDAEAPGADGWWFWQQVAACRYELPPNGRYENDLRWFVPNTHRTDTPTGPQLTHDDRLLSAALVALYDELHRTGKILLGHAISAVIAPRDPLANMRF